MKPEFGLLDNHEFLSEIRRAVLRRSDFVLVGLSLLIAFVAGAMLLADRSNRDFFVTLRETLTP